MVWFSWRKKNTLQVFLYNWVLNSWTQGNLLPCVQWYQITAKHCWALTTQAEFWTKKSAGYSIFPEFDAQSDKSSEQNSACSQTTLTSFWLFWPPTICWHFFPYQLTKSQHFLDYLPASSCQHSLWTTHYNVTCLMSVHVIWTERWMLKLWVSKNQRNLKL